MTLVLHDRNPLPPGAVAGFTRTADGVSLRFARWPAVTQHPRGTVLLLQGRAEFLEKYAETAGDLLARGYAVVTFDWRGQGRSERLLGDADKGHVGRFADYATDLAAILDGVVAPDTPGPLYAIGHSMGGLVLLTLPDRLRERFRRLVLVAPLIGLGRYGLKPETISRLARSLAAAGLGRRWVPGGGPQSIHTLPFEGNPLTSDPRRYGRNAALVRAAPGLAVGAPTIGWLAAACRAMAAVDRVEVAEAIAVPTLLFACGLDEVVSTPAIERFGRAMRVGGAVQVPGARHELLQEADIYREQFWAAFDAFVTGG